MQLCFGTTGSWAVLLTQRKGTRSLASRSSPPFSDLPLYFSHSNTADISAQSSSFPKLKTSSSAVYQRNQGTFCRDFCLPIVDLRLLVQILGIAQTLKAIEDFLSDFLHSLLSFEVPSFPGCLLFIGKIFVSLAHLLSDMHYMFFLLSKQNSYLSLSCEVIQCRIISWVFCIMKMLLLTVFLTES